MNYRYREGPTLRCKMKFNAIAAHMVQSSSKVCLGWCWIFWRGTLEEDTIKVIFTHYFVENLESFSKTYLQHQLFLLKRKTNNQHFLLKLPTIKTWTFPVETWIIHTKISCWNLNQLNTWFFSYWSLNQMHQQIQNINFSCWNKILLTTHAWIGSTVITHYRITDCTNP